MKQTRDKHATASEGAETGNVHCQGSKARRRMKIGRMLRALRRCGAWWCWGAHQDGWGGNAARFFHPSLGPNPWTSWLAFSDGLANDRYNTGSPLKYKKKFKRGISRVPSGPSLGSQPEGKLEANRMKTCAGLCNMTPLNSFPV